MRANVVYTLVLDCNAFVIYYNDNEDYLVEPIDKGKHHIEPRGYNQVFVLDSNQNFVSLGNVRESNLVCEHSNNNGSSSSSSSGSGIDLETSALLFKSMFSGTLGSGSKNPPKPEIEIV